MSENQEKPLRDYYKYLVKVQTGEKQCSGVLIRNNVIASTVNCALQNDLSKKIFVYEEGIKTEYPVINVTHIDPHQDSLYPHTPVLLEINRNKETFSIEISEEKYSEKKIILDAWQTRTRIFEEYKKTARSYNLTTVPFEKCEQNNRFNVRLDSYQVGARYLSGYSGPSNIHLGSPAFEHNASNPYKLSGLLTACFDNVETTKYLYSSFVDLSNYRSDILTALDKIPLAKIPEDSSGLAR